MLICFGTWFIILPIFYHSLSDNLIKTAFFILTLILLEIIVSKMGIISTIGVGLVGKTDKESFIDSTNSKKILNVLKKRTCHLLLHTLNPSVEKSLLDNNYILLDSGLPKDRKIQIYDNYYNLVITSDLSNFALTIADERYRQFTKYLIKALKKNFCPGITIILNVEDLINLDKGNLPKNLYHIVQHLSTTLKSRFNLNITINNLSKIEGFSSFLEITNTQATFNISYISNIYDLQDNLEKFSNQFQGLQQRLMEQLIQTNVSSSYRYQLSYIMIHELKKLQKPMKQLIGSIVLTKGKKFFVRSQPMLVTINFINSTKI
jgi:hypothetical protein